MTKRKKIILGVLITILVLAGVFCCLFLTGGIAYAAGLVDETLNAENLYSKYGLKNYQLDFYVDTSGGWLPWNWGDSIGKSVMYGLYIITNGLWMINVNLSSVVGSMISEAYNLDFIGSMADSLGTNLQTIAGVSSSGFSSDGLYVKMLPWLIAVAGVYVGYHGLVKHEASKALNGLLNFIIVFIASAAFIAYSPDYISSINEFSTDMSTAMLDVGAKILVPGSDVEGEDSVDIIRDSLFSIQVYKPWLLLQYGTTDVDAIGQERIDNLLGVSPSSGEVREDAVKKEVVDYANANMSVTEVAGRFGNVLLLMVINIVISIFVLLLTGIMLLSQLLFIMFCMFLPVSFLVSMIPGQEGRWKQAVMKVFNTMIMRAGISLVITIAFCLSNMVYGMTEASPFLLIGFLQILVFAGIFIELRELLGMISLQNNETASLGRRMFYRPFMRGRRFARRHFRNMGRNMRRMTTAGAAGYALGTREREADETENSSVKRNLTGTVERRTGRKQGLGERTGNTLGHAAGTMADFPARVTDNMKKPVEKLVDLPMNARYAAYSIEKGFKEELAQSKENRQERQNRRQNLKEYKRMEMSGSNEALNNQLGQESKKNVRQSGGVEFQKQEKGKVAMSQQKKMDVGKLPKGAVLNQQRSMGEQTVKEKFEKGREKQYHSPARTALNTPKIRGENGRQELKIKQKTLSPVEQQRSTGLIRSGGEKYKAKSSWNDVGKLPKGATLNQSTRVRETGKKSRKE